jgi:hypothetical protein
MDDFAYFQLAIGIVFALATAYACGRLHQWYRQTDDRDQAFREGYDKATHSLFSLAARTRRAVSPRPSPGPVVAKAAAPPVVTPPPPVVAKGPRAVGTVTAITDAPSNGRHAVPVARLENQTYDLTGRASSESA